MYRPGNGPRAQSRGIDGTRKYLFRLADGNVIESVLMRYHHGNSVCVSSQVGCRMGCRFCASTLDGLTTEPGARRRCWTRFIRFSAIRGERVSNVVVMGSGEPLDNYDNLVRFIRLLTGGRRTAYQPAERDGFHLRAGAADPASWRIEGLTVTLALSLHAPNDEVRKTPDAGRAYTYCA